MDIDFPLCRTAGTFLWSKPSTQILTCKFEISLTNSGMELKKTISLFLTDWGMKSKAKSVCLNIHVWQPFTVIRNSTISLIVRTLVSLQVPCFFNFKILILEINTIVRTWKYRNIIMCKFSYTD